MCPADPPEMSDFGTEAYGSRRSCTSWASALTETAEIPPIAPLAIGTRSVCERACRAEMLGEKGLILLDPDKVGRRDAHAFVREERCDVGIPIVGCRGGYVSRNQTVNQRADRIRRRLANRAHQQQRVIGCRHRGPRDDDGRDGVA